MPWQSMDDVPANIRELDGTPLTLSQCNEIGEMYDAMKGDGSVDNPMAAAISKWKEAHQVQDGKWVSMMAELSGVEIFAAGKYPQGDFPEATLHQIAGNYDPGYHEAPSYVDHADAAGKRSACGAACGWVDKVYVRGSKLLADIRQVPDAFVELLKAGRLKKRSVEIYPDLNGKGPYLRALAWLGADVPQVKGLADVAFRDDEPSFITVEFSDGSKAKIRKSADKRNSHTRGVNDMAEEKVQNADPKKDATLDVTGLTAQFAESQKQVSDLSEKLTTALTVIEEMRKGQAQSVIDARKAEITVFCDQMVSAFKMSPAERKLDEPILWQMVSVDNFDENQKSLLKAKREYYLNRKPMQAGAFDANKDGSVKTTIQAEKDALVAQFNERREQLVPLGVKMGSHIYGGLWQKGFSADEIITVLSPDERKQVNAI